MISLQHIYSTHAHIDTAEVLVLFICACTLYSSVLLFAVLYVFAKQFSGDSNERRCKAAEQHIVVCDISAASIMFSMHTRGAQWHTIISSFHSHRIMA